MPVLTSTLGFPRIGRHREHKTALEGFWSGTVNLQQFLTTTAALRRENWSAQKRAGIDLIPSNDFSLYDHMLDMSALIGAVPAIYGAVDGPVSLETYFAMARGTSGHKGQGLPALAMTKWFDTNYHYMVPELSPEQTFSLLSTKPVNEFKEAKAAGFATRPVLVGPITYLLLSRTTEPFDPLSLLPGLVKVYAELIRRLVAEGASWIQIDEPCLVTDPSDDARAAYVSAYRALNEAVPNAKLLLTTYFGSLGDNLDLALSLPVSGLHIDLKRGPDQLDEILHKAPSDLTLSLGVIDGRNVWRADLNQILDHVEPIVAQRGAERIVLAPSCSLMYVPLDLALETELDSDVRRWLAFATQKMDELRILARALNEGRASVAAELRESDEAAADRKKSLKIHNAAVTARLAAVSPEMSHRAVPYAERRQIQKSILELPEFPTTTIGSFPQTDAVRKIRAAFSKGTLSPAEYEAALRHETETAIRWQEDIGLDVLVHGEFERNEMVQYFGEQLSGYLFTKRAWVQSYGHRYVRPPIIFGDVSRPAPISLKWSSYAQSLTAKPVKGMVTGPVTMLQWSFVRDDTPRSTICKQIALALRDEVQDLEKAGLRIIQIDEPALREGLPLRKSDWPAYLDWATECFRLTSSGVTPGTQIHTHMCYSDFNDIIESIGALDADVISIETARSKMELLNAFKTYKYPNEIGPGVYDIHIARLPAINDMAALLKAAACYIPADRLWVNPDCGLKTRKWEEVRPALVNMVAAAKTVRMPRN